MFGGARRSPIRQAAGIDQVLGTELAHGPSETRAELDAEKVTYFTINAIADATLQFSLWIADVKRCVERDRLIHLDAGSRDGDIFQVGDRTTQLAGLILPLDIDEVRA